MGLRHRFQDHLCKLCDQDEPASLRSANYWIQEENERLMNNECALQKSNFRLQRYLRWRKERVLNFLQMLCRDEKNMSRQELGTVLYSFAVREDRLLQQHKNLN